LDVEQQRVHTRQLLRGGLFALAVEAVNRQPCALVDAIGHSLVQLPANAVFGAEQRADRDAQPSQQVY
jgi:hypothetical protein